MKKNQWTKQPQRVLWGLGTPLGKSPALAAVRGRLGRLPGLSEVLPSCSWALWGFCSTMRRLVPWKGLRPGKRIFLDLVGLALPYSWDIATLFWTIGNFMPQGRGG